MPTTEAYRPGLLSSLLLGTETEGAAGTEDGATAKDVVAAVSGTAQPEKKKKKKPKKTKRDSDEASSSSAAGVVASPKEKRLVAAAAPAPAEGVEGLASLFSPGNLTKFKRRERADKDADAAEVRAACGCRVPGFSSVVWLKQNCFTRGAWQESLRTACGHDDRRSCGLNLAQGCYSSTAPIPEPSLPLEYVHSFLANTCFESRNKVYSIETTRSCSSFIRPHRVCQSMKTAVSIFFRPHHVAVARVRT